MELLIVITDRRASENFVRLYQERGIPLTLAALGRGTATKETLDALGLEESEKAILMSAANGDLIKEALKEVNKTLGIKNPGTSVVFTVPLTSVCGGAAAKYLANNRPIERKEYPMSTDESFELIIAIVNEGYSAAAMEAAREKGGATGGTILHARGVGMESAQKFFGISISEEKELIFIACRASCRNKIMQSIIDEAGQKTKAKGIVFSAPISSAAGLWILRDEK